MLHPGFHILMCFHLTALVADDPPGAYQQIYPPWQPARMGLLQSLLPSHVCPGVSTMLSSKKQKSSGCPHDCNVPLSTFPMAGAEVSPIPCAKHPCTKWCSFLGKSLAANDSVCGLEALKMVWKFS